MCLPRGLRVAISIVLVGVSSIFASCSTQSGGVGVTALSQIPVTANKTVTLVVFMDSPAGWSIKLHDVSSGQNFPLDASHPSFTATTNLTLQLTEIKKSTATTTLQPDGAGAFDPVCRPDGTVIGYVLRAQTGTTTISRFITPIGLTVQ